MKNVFWFMDIDGKSELPESIMDDTNEIVQKILGSKGHIELYVEPKEGKVDKEGRGPRAVGGTPIIGYVFDDGKLMHHGLGPTGLEIVEQKGESFRLFQLINHAKRAQGVDPEAAFRELVSQAGGAQ